MLWEIKTLNWSVRGVLNIFGYIFIYLFTFLFLFYYMFLIFLFSIVGIGASPHDFYLYIYEINKQSSLLNKRCTCLFSVFSIRQNERESLKFRTNTDISALIIWIAKVPSWWWIPRWSRAASLKENLCSTLKATPKWDTLTTP